MLQFVEKFNGRNFIKDAYQKLAWAELINGNKAGYNSYMELCKSKGYTIVGSDQSAENEAVKEEVPDKDLLKARLLFDGGRYGQAYTILKKLSEDRFQSKKHKLEYSYRLGRTLHKLGKFDDALYHYQLTIKNGIKEPWYFACRSALERGLIYEEIGQHSFANKAFERCLDISPEEHKSGLHQQAKAGLRRLKNY